MIKSKFVPLFLIFLGLISILSYILRPDPSTDIYLNIIYLIPSFLATILGIDLLKRMGVKNKKGNIYLLLTIAVALWFVGESLWFLYKIVLDLDHFPSYIDVVYLAAYPIFFVAFWKEYKLNKIIWTTKKILISSISAVTLTSLTGYYGIYMSYDAEASFWENSFSILYGVGDLAIIFVLILIIMIVSSYQKGKFLSIWIYFLLAMLFTIFADILYAMYYQEYNKGIKIFQYLDLLWIISFIFFAQGFYKANKIIFEIQSNLINKK